MSYVNLIQGVGTSKPSQDLNVNTITCGTLDCVDADITNLIVNQQDIQNLFIGSLNASIPATEIEVNSDLNLNNNSITSKVYNTSNVNDNVSVYSISNRNINVNTNTILTNWTTMKTSSRVNVDPITGTFSPDEGLYCMTYQSTIVSPANNTEMGVRIVDDLGTTIYQSVQNSTDLFAPDTGVEAAQYENLTAYFDGTRSYTLNVKLNANETANYQVIISRIM